MKNSINLFKKYLYVNSSGKFSCKYIPKEDFEKMCKMLGIKLPKKKLTLHSYYLLKERKTGLYVTKLIRKGKKIIYYVTKEEIRALHFNTRDLEFISNLRKFKVEAKSSKKSHTSFKFHKTKNERKYELVRSRVYESHKDERK